MSGFTIEIKPTTSPKIVKFITPRFLSENRSYEFHNVEEAKVSPLAQQLFYLPFVKKVFISQNFIAIEKYDIVEWKDVQLEVADAIAVYLDSGEEVFKEETKSTVMPVSVYAESTPNPAAMKFILNRKLLEGRKEFKDISETTGAPLAAKLFNFPFVKEVFFQDNFISLTKYEMIEWEEITMEIRSFIKNYIDQGLPVIEDIKAQNAQVYTTTNSSKNLTAFEQKIVSALDEYVTPAVATDGGHISFQSYDESTGKVSVVLQGACSGCPSSTVTLKNGIENLLKQLLGEKIKEVIAVNG